jgi:hypothetical protein
LRPAAPKAAKTIADLGEPAQIGMAFTSFQQYL